MAAGCGGDDSGETTSEPAVSIPAVTAPGLTTSTAAPTATTGGTTATGEGDKTYDPNQPDSATNDVPPAAGSPQAQFEQQCRKNPSACG
jgi:hypothetical protein